ncbi:hypothetical protein [Agaribacterium sp. ZY112]|uniref:hypothetical protein n=1 Tax=Agaribacterium sp. ZY112 TaxID=3233574 RepID=UPI003525B41B
MKVIFFVFLMVASLGVNSAETYLAGDVTSITSIPQGLLLRINGNEKPSGCTQSSAWMLIPEERKTMISVALAMYMSGNRKAVVYISTSASGSYCVINQYDPQH